MQPRRRALGLVLIAGPDLWPALDAAAQWGVDAAWIRVLHAPGEEEPGGSVDRLSALLRRHFPANDIAILDPVAMDDPEPTRSRLSSLVSGLPEVEWRVCTDGDERLVFAAALGASHEHERLRVVVRDDPATWHELLPDGSAVLVPGVDDRAMDRFTVAELLRVTWADEDRRVRLASRTVPPQLAEAARRCLAGEDWSTCLDRARLQMSREGLIMPSGLAFEGLVAELLRLLGVGADDVAVGAVLDDDGMAVQEIDVVANSRGRLHVIDCKLYGVDGVDAAQSDLMSQVREADSTRRQVGDGAGQFILLRPTREVREPLVSLCQAYGILVIDQRTLEHVSLPQVLARLWGPPAVRPHRGLRSTATLSTTRSRRRRRPRWPPSRVGGRWRARVPGTSCRSA